MKLSREWLQDYVDLSGIPDERLAERFTAIGHAVESVERHGQDTVFDLEITTNRVDAMSHLGMARELAAALGREVKRPQLTAVHAPHREEVKIRIDVPEMCGRFSAMAIRNVQIKPSPETIQRRLQAVGLRPINNVVDVTNYVMLSLGHPMHAYDLDKLAGATIIVRAGKAGESMRSLDGQMRSIDPETVVISDAQRAVGLGGIIGGAESEISSSTHNVLLECAWFEPSAVRRTARRLGIKTDASYRFERRVDPNDTVDTILLAAQLITEMAGGEREGLIDVVAKRAAPRPLRLRTDRLHAASEGAVGPGYAIDLFRRIGFDAEAVSDGVMVIVPTFRGDISEETDLIEEVLRFFGYDNVPSYLPRLTTGDMRANTIGEAEDQIRSILAGSGLSEVVNYSFIPGDGNGMFEQERQLAIINALSENIGAMRLSLLPGLLETVAFNRSYGTRDGALFEIGRTYHRTGEGVREHHRAAIVLFGTVGTFWGDAKRPVDFFDVKGVVEQLAAKLHVPLAYGESDASWLTKGKRAVARYGQEQVATFGFVAAEILQRFGIKGEVGAAEIDLEALLRATGQWKMNDVPRFPGVPMILALTHGRELTFQKLVETIRSLQVPHLQEVGLRDRFIPEGQESVKTTLGMWYQAFDRSLTQEEVGRGHQDLARRVAEILPVKLVTQ